MLWRICVQLKKYCEIKLNGKILYYHCWIQNLKSKQCFLKIFYQRLTWSFTANWGILSFCWHMVFLTTTPLLLSTSQRPQTWSSMPKLWNRPPTWRTDPCMCCSAPRRSTVCPVVLTKPTLAPTAAFSASPPKSTTTASQTSGRGQHTTPGSGMSVTGETRSLSFENLICLSNDSTGVNVNANARC